MKKPFEYSVLYYQHSSLTGERFVIGLLFFFPFTKDISLVVPKSLKKLSVFQNDFEISFIRKILQRLESKANTLSDRLRGESLDFAGDFSDLINFEFIIPDASSIQYSTPKKGIIPDDTEKIIQYYSSLYFKNYHIQESKTRIDDHKIIETFSKSIKVRLPSYKKYIEENVTINGDFFDEKFQFGWQNGKYNYVTSISFDLEREESIKKKSQQQIGVLSNLQDIILKNNSNIHFLIAKPSKSSLHKAYDNALAILESYRAQIGKVIEYNDLDQYVEEVIDSAKVLPRAEYK